MSLTNAPDPEIRAAVVRQDLQNVLHPIVQHKVLETKQMVVTGAHGSTIYDADGTAYLDAMAGLWCVNIGYGRGELADVAADQMQQLAYFPHTQMNVPAAALAEKINTLMGGGYHTYFVNSGLRGERGRLQDRPAVPEARAPGRVPLQDRQPLLRLSRHHARHARRRRHGRPQGEVRAVLGRLRPRRAAVLLPLPVRPELSELRPGLREEHGKRHPGREPRHRRRGDRRADHERDRRRRAAGRVPEGGGGDLPPLRHPAARRRGDQRLRPHRQDVRPPALRRRRRTSSRWPRASPAPTCRSPRPW